MTKKIKNPLNSEKTIKEVSVLFGQTIARKICTTPVFKYSHKGLGEGIGDRRNKN